MPLLSHLLSLLQGGASPPPPLFGASGDSWQLGAPPVANTIFAFEEDIPDVGERVPVRAFNNVP